MATPANSDLLVGGDTLIDSVGLVLAAVTAQTLGIRILVPQLDYLHLLLLNGGIRFDENGVASIDTDIHFLDEAISYNEQMAPVQAAARPNVNLAEETAALALLRVLIDRGLATIIRYRPGSYGDGTSFVLTGDPDLTVTDPVHHITLTYSEESLIGDALATSWRKDYWRSELDYVSQAFLERLLDSTILQCQIWTRFMTLGVAVREGLPVFSARSRTNELLQTLFDTTGRIHLSDKKIARVGIVQEALSLRPDQVTVEDVARLLDGGLSEALLGVHTEKLARLDKLAIRRHRQDFALLLVSLLASPFNVIGPVVDILSYLYQRMDSGDD